MRYTLILGQKNYSSWSMRAWLLLKMLNVPFEEITVPLYTTQSRETVRALGGQTGLVPVLKFADTAIWDTLAIFEHFQETHAVWPENMQDRALARSVSGEIHSSFTALREAMPVNTRARGRAVKITDAVRADIGRVEEIWAARKGGTPWLFDSFSGADIMFAPVATRFQTYGVELNEIANSYKERLLAHPLVSEWLRLGREEKDTIPCLELG
jgi:glutathione S-transferase